MHSRPVFVGTLAAALLAAGFGLGILSGQGQGGDKAPQKKAPPDAVTDITQQQGVPADRPEQKLSQHDKSDVFNPDNTPPSSKALLKQPEQGKLPGFDFARDPLDSLKPKTTFAEVFKKESGLKAKVMALQRKLLETRYNLKPKLDPAAKMSRGKPLCVGPTARLAEGMTWEKLAQMSAEDIRAKGLFPYLRLPHPKHTPGGMVFPKSQIAMFPRLERFDVDLDLPEEFLPEFPPAMFLQSRPELGDVSRGQVITLNNFNALFVDILTPVQMDGLRLLLTPMPQEEFNATEDRRTVRASPGVACFDCHVNGHTSGQIELSPDIRPQQRRLRLDTPTIRGMYNQQLHGSKRSIRSLRDFAQFEQRTAYFNGDQIHAAKKGEFLIPPHHAVRMERMQAMLDFPPAPKLTVLGTLNPKKASESEKRGQKLFFGKAQCSFCHPAPFYTDNFMHNLQDERFHKEPPTGPVKTFSLRGLKDSPPYLHDGRCLTLEDTVEYFNLILELNLSAEEKRDLVAFMRCL